MALTLLGFSGLLLTVFVHQCFCAVEKDLVCNDLDCSPQTACACVGNNVTIPWNIPNYPDDIFTVSWTLENATSNIKPVLSQSGSGSPNIEDNFNVVHNGKGSITLISVTTENTGIYKCDVNYNLGSGSPVIGTVTVSVYDTPGDLDYTAVSDTVYQCKAGYDGSPATSLDIWVNGVNQNSDKATVKKSDFVECCRSGKAVRCMSDVSTGCTSIKKCITVQRPTTTSITTTNSSTTSASTVPTVTTSTTTSTTTTSNNNSDNTGIIVGACVGSFALLLGICIFVCLWLRSKTNNTKKKSSLEINKSDPSYDNGRKQLNSVRISDTRNPSFGQNN